MSEHYLSTRTPVKPLTVRFVRGGPELYDPKNLGVYLVLEATRNFYDEPAWLCLVLHKDVSDRFGAGNTAIYSDDWLVSWSEPWT